MAFLDDYELIKLKKLSKTKNDENFFALNDPPKVAEKKMNTAKIIQCLRRDNFKKTKSCDVCNLFKSYEDFLKDMPARMQRSFKFDMASTFAKYQSRLLKSYALMLCKKPIAQNRNQKSSSEIRSSGGSGSLQQDNKKFLDAIMFCYRLRLPSRVYKT